MINSIIYFEEKCIHRFEKQEKAWKKKLSIFLNLTHKHSHKILYIIGY